jgi:hypothetical protein
MKNLCDWSYKRYPHIVTIKHTNYKSDKPDEYILFGDKVEGMPDYNYIKSKYYIEEDDNIQQVLTKISYELRIDINKIYIYADNTNRELGETVNLKYNYFISSGRPIVIENINIVPNFFDYNLNKIEKLQKELYKPETNNTINLLQTTTVLHKNNLENNILSTFNLNLSPANGANGARYYNNIKIIIFDEAYKLIKSTQHNTNDVKIQLLSLYFPDYKLLLKESYINFNEIKLELDKNEKIIDKLFINKKTINQSNKISYTPCIITEVIIHINYNVINPDFIDQLKIFHTLRLTEEIPFVKYKGDSNITPMFRIYKDVLNKENPHYISKEELETWFIGVKKNKMSGNEHLLTGKGLSYKIFLYNYYDSVKKTNINKYLTLNIYKNGRLEIKCNWGDELSGNVDNIKMALEKVHKFIESINKTDFKLIGQNLPNKINEPDLNYLKNINTNTKIAFYNINYRIETPKKIKLNKFETFIKKYDLFINYIEKNKEEINDNIKLRYKRINGFLKMDKINNYIYTLIKNDFTKEEIINAVENKYKISKEEAKKFYGNYINLCSKKNINITSNNTVLKNKFIMTELIKGKNPGIDISINYKNNNLYKVIILGAPHNNIGQIYNFINTAIELYFEKISNKVKTTNKNKNKFDYKLFDFDDFNISEDVQKQQSSQSIQEAQIVSPVGTGEDANDLPEPNETNLLKRLKVSNPTLFYDDKYKNKSYSRNCQQNIKRPLVITSKKANNLLIKYQKMLETETDKKQIKYLNEIIETLNVKGRHIKGYFYFCPTKWDGDTYEAVGPNSKNIINKKKYVKLGFSNNMCQPCCMKDHVVNKHVVNDKLCMNKFNGIKEEEVETNDNPDFNIIKNKYYILDSSKMFIDYPNRYILLPSKLNEVVNPNKMCKSTDKYITCILRKTIKKGNQFVNIFKGLLNIEEDTVFINKIIQLIKSNINIYRLLKNGSIYTTFIDDTNVSTYYNSVELTYLSAQNFINYISLNIESINEKFLWDLLSFENMIYPEGLNIFIIEATIGTQNNISDIIIKCPTGYDINQLYKPNRNSIIIYKYNNTYELLCMCEYNIKKIKSTQVLFNSNHEIITNLLNNIHKCNPVININTNDELNKYINNVSHSTIIDSLSNYESSYINIYYIEQMINKMILNFPGEFDDFKIKYQIVDRYNQVRYLILYNNLAVPIFPSPISLKYIINYNLDTYTLSYYDTITKVLILEKYALLKYLAPFCFLINPGPNLTDPTDDIVTDIMLINGFIINVKHILVDEAIKEQIIINKPKNMNPIIFDSNSLLFKENMIVNDNVITKKDVHSQYKYNDELFVDKKILFDENIKDNRIKFNIRLQYEEETFELIRYELSKYLQTADGQNVKATILKIINNINMNIVEKRTKIFNIISKIIYGFIITTDELLKLKTGDFINELEQQIGPINMSFENSIKVEEKEKVQVKGKEKGKVKEKGTQKEYKYNYIRPVFKNSCKDTEGDGRVHCYNNKLIVNSINLNTGNRYNVNNYIQRINEDILRNPIKRSEIFEDRITNYNIISPYIKEEIFVDYENDINNNNINISTYINNLYNTKVATIEEKDKDHYNNKNPENDFNYITSNIYNNEYSCEGDYKLLPEFWINKLKNNKFMIYETKSGQNNCIFTLIKRAKETLYNNIFINDLKISIINEISNNNNYINDKKSPKELWELTKIAYYEIYKINNFNEYSELFEVDNVDDFQKAVKNNDREICIVDLNIISYIINVKFIILCDPNKLCPSGIECIGSTNTLDNLYILLYKTKFNTYQIITDITYIVDKMIFSGDDLADNIIYEAWRAQCGNTDEKSFINKINNSFKPNRYITNYNEQNGKLIINESVDNLNEIDSEIIPTSESIADSGSDSESVLY